MSTVDLSNHSGNQALAQWERPSDYAACSRCGVTRRIHPGRSSKNLCRDCWLVENETARIEPEPVNGYIPIRGPAGIVRFRPVPERLSAEDRAWCERAAAAGFWRQWERANRGRSNPLQAEAMRLSRALSTRSVDTPLPYFDERMFDSNDQSEGAA